MSHSFPNLSAHPTLTPNPTFQPQPHPLPLTLTTMSHPPKQQSQQSSNPPSNPTNTNTNHNISPLPPPSQHPSIHTPMQFIPPPPHTYTHTHTMIRRPNATPDYNQLTLRTGNPPPLTHENDIVSQDLNDINTSTSNDESNSNTTNSNNTKPNPSNKNNNSGEKELPNGNKTPPNHPPPIMNPSTPFGNIYMDTGPFGSTSHSHALDDRKPLNQNKLSYYGVMPSPFMPHTQLNTYEHDNDNKDNNNPTNHSVPQWQFALVPPQIPNVAPMFGHPAYLPNDAYLRRPNYGEQTMVDVPHATQIISEDIDNNKNPSISMLIGTTNNIQPALNIEHSINTNNHIQSPSKSDRSSTNRSRERDTHKKKKKRRKHRDHKREKRKHRSNNKEDTKSKYVSIRDEQSVKGGAGNGYRMVLDEPVNKNMLSCHQCKNKKTLDRIIVCGHVYRINNTVKTCTKKYCKSCLLRFYLEAPPTDNQDPSWSSWKCPCCRYICCCAWCRKKKAKRLESVSNAIRAEAHRLTPAISLARKLVSESRVNNGSNGNNSNENVNGKRGKRMHRNHNDLPPQI